MQGSSTLSWSIRYKVAIGIAEAIAYLHNGTERCIVHRDIKPSNILLSSKKTPKVDGNSLMNFIGLKSNVMSEIGLIDIDTVLQLCDFGLATWTSAPSIPFLCKTVKGTFGYDLKETHDRAKKKTRKEHFFLLLCSINL